MHDFDETSIGESSSQISLSMKCEQGNICEIMQMINSNCHSRSVSRWNNSEKKQFMFKLRHEMILYILCTQIGVSYGEKPLRDLFPHIQWTEREGNLTPDLIIQEKGVVMDLCVTLDLREYTNKILKYNTIAKKLDCTVYPLVLHSFIAGVNEGVNQLETALGILLDFDLINKILNWITLDLKSAQASDPRITEEQPIHFTCELTDSELKENLKKMEWNPISERVLHDLFDESSMYSKIEPDPDHDTFMNSIVNFTIGKIEENLREENTMLMPLFPHIYADVAWENYLSFRKQTEQNILNRVGNIDFGLCNILPTPFIEDFDPVYDFDDNFSFRFEETFKLLGEYNRQIANPVDLSIHRILKNSQEVDSIGRGTFYSDVIQEDIRTISDEGPWNKATKRQLGRFKMVPLDADLSELSELMDKWSKPILNYKHVWNPMSRLISDVIAAQVIEKYDSTLGGWNLRFMQTLFQELVIHSQKVEAASEKHGKKFFSLFKLPGFKVICLIKISGYPWRQDGVCWYKLFLPKGVCHDSQFWPRVRPWNKSFVCTRFLMCNRYRMDHYLRIRDCVITTTVTHVDKCLTPSQSLLEDESNTFAVISLIAANYSRPLSNMLLKIRYISMGLLSFKFDIMKFLITKFNDPLRSPMQIWLLRRLHKFFHDMKEFGENHLLKGTPTMLLETDEDAEDVTPERGAQTLLFPRILTEGKPITFDGFINEFYFSHFFNKDLGDKTQDARQITVKILEEEESHLLCKRENQHYVIPNLDLATQINHALGLMEHPRDHHFSPLAVTLGMRFMSMSENHSCVLNSTLTRAGLEAVRKTSLSSLATLKSSSGDIVKYAKTDKDIRRLGKRKKVAEGIFQLVSETKIFSLGDLVKHSLQTLKDVHIQIFKKNQIGGTREILILRTLNRITTYFIEKMSKTICRADKREMLTSGKVKLKDMSSAISQLLQSYKNSFLLTKNFDATSWCQNFIPIMFLFLYTPLININKDLFKTILLILCSHCNKMIEYPQNLLREWLDGTEEQESEVMRERKIQYLKTGNSYFRNESNMGQGILHYTSSLMHICYSSFRDEVINRVCKKMSIRTEGFKIKTLISSDDRTDFFLMDRKQNDDLLKLILVINTVEDLCLPLFAIRESVKTTWSTLISEFNQIYASKLSVTRGTVKFAYQMCQLFDTTNPQKLLQMYIGSMKEALNEGCSLVSCAVANYFNKEYFEYVYKTFNGGVNCIDEETHGFNPSCLGHWPKLPTLSLLVGGIDYWDWTCYNYALNQNEPVKSNILNVLKNSCKIDSVIYREGQEEYINLQLDYNKTNRVMQNILEPSKILTEKRKLLGLDKSTILDIFCKDPSLVLRDPESVEECLIKCAEILWSPGANESLRDLSKCQYFQKIVTTKESKTWRTHILDTPDTFRQCQKLLMSVTPDLTTMESLKLIFNRQWFHDLKAAQELCEQYEGFKPRRLDQPIRLRTHCERSGFVVTRMSVGDILYKVFFRPQDAQKGTDEYAHFKRWQKILPWLSENLDITCENLCGSKEPIDKVMVLVHLVRLLGKKSEINIHRIAFGRSTATVESTMLNLHIHNTTHNQVVIKTSSERLRDVNVDFRYVTLLHNLIMAILKYSSICTRDTITTMLLTTKVADSQGRQKDDRNLFQIGKALLKNSNVWYGLADKYKKTMMILSWALLGSVDTEAYMRSCNKIFISWVKSQRKINVEGELKWEGDFICEAFLGDTKILVVFKEEERCLYCLTDSSEIYKIHALINRVCQLAFSMGVSACLSNHIFRMEGTTGLSIISDKAQVKIVSKNRDGLLRYTMVSSLSETRRNYLLSEGISDANKNGIVILNPNSSMTNIIFTMNTNTMHIRLDFRTFEIFPCGLHIKNPTFKLGGLTLQNLVNSGSLWKVRNPDKKTAILETIATKTQFWSEPKCLDVLKDRFRQTQGGCIWLQTLNWLKDFHKSMHRTGRIKYGVMSKDVFDFSQKPNIPPRECLSKTKLIQNSIASKDKISLAKLLMHEFTTPRETVVLRDAILSARVTKPDFNINDLDEYLIVQKPCLRLFEFETELLINVLVEINQAMFKDKQALADQLKTFLANDFNAFTTEERTSSKDETQINKPQNIGIRWQTMSEICQMMDFASNRLTLIKLMDSSRRFLPENIELIQAMNIMKILKRAPTNRTEEAAACLSALTETFTRPSELAQTISCALLSILSKSLSDPEQINWTMFWEILNELNLRPPQIDKLIRLDMQIKTTIDPELDYAQVKLAMEKTLDEDENYMKISDFVYVNLNEDKIYQITETGTLKLFEEEDDDVVESQESF